MKSIERIRIINFKRFQAYEIKLNENRNILIGDNEAGKSTILHAIDICVSGNKSKIDAIGLENLFNRTAIQNFFQNGGRYEQLPQMKIEVFVNGNDDEYFNGRNNTRNALFDGVRLRCSPDESLSKEIIEILATGSRCFPFEYYKIEFETFRGEYYPGTKRPFKHVLIDTSASNGEYANREYIKSMYDNLSIGHEKATHSFVYRSSKDKFQAETLKSINERSEYSFGLRNNSKSNFESDLTVYDGGIAIEYKGKGQQCFIKANFALSKKKGGHDIVLIEEPENHLSHMKMRSLITEIGTAKSRQLIITTHNPLICSRLDLRNIHIVSNSGNRPTILQDLPNEVAEFFIKAPDNSILEFVLSPKCILVEGDAEYILLESFFMRITGKAPHECGVAILSANGTGFKNYMHVAKANGTRLCVIRDNDKFPQEICIDRYADYVSDSIQVFFDKSSLRHTFEVCLYEDNKSLCDSLFLAGRRTLTVQDYMLSNKTDAAYELLTKKAQEIVIPEYIQKAISWVNS